MNNPIVLSDADLALAANPEIMLAKNRIIQAVYELFGELADGFRQAATDLPPALTHMHPKIARGENYLGQPWVMLDYPRRFSGEDIFAVRTLFWWGHSFSLHLLLRGQYLSLLSGAALAALENKEGWYFNTGNDPWQHHPDPATAIPLVSCRWVEDLEKQRIRNGFYKLSCQLPLQEWKTALPFLEARFFAALQMVKPL